MHRVVIVDVGSGNLRSAAKAVERVAATAAAPHQVAVSSVPEAVRTADRVVLPGQGAFADVWMGLAQVPGMLDAVAEVVHQGRPLFGICVGMQVMATRGLEHGDHPGFGWIPGVVDRLSPSDPALKIPHMGWNDLALTDAGRAHPVLRGVDTGEHVYFVHSYALQAGRAQDVLAEVDYGGRVAAIVGRDTVIGTQFHAEKSQATGLRLLANFLAWAP